MIRRFVHVSDIHFGQEKNGTKIPQDDARRKLVEDVAEFAKMRGKADLVLVLGDVAYSGKAEEYRSAGLWLDNLTRAAGCAETDVAVVPGNHDCDRSELNVVSSVIHQNIRGGSVANAHMVLDQIANGREEANLILPKFKAFREFAASYNSDFVSAVAPSWTKNLPLGNGVTLRFIGLTSVQICDSDDRLGSMVLGCSQYVFPDEPDVINVVMMHHPIEWFMDATEARQYLHSRARVIMVGHEHLPRVHYTQDQAQNAWIDVHSGAATPPTDDAPYTHAYNWIEIGLRQKGGQSVLAVEVFPRAWLPEKTRFLADRRALPERDSIVFEIPCTSLRSAVPAAMNAPEPPLRMDQSESAPPAASAPQDAAKIEKGLIKLKFLFWRHLDWQQRLQVLVKADVLPKNADRPLPQTMERLALDRARVDGKLRAVWDAMLPLLPSEKRDSNPF